LRAALAAVSILVTVQCTFSLSGAGSVCDARQDRGSGRLDENPTDELAVLQARMEHQQLWRRQIPRRRRRFRYGKYRGRYHYHKPTTPMPTTTGSPSTIMSTTSTSTTIVPVPAQWISAPQGMPCSSACSVLNSEGNIFQCGKEEMAAINSSTAIMTLVSDLNLTVPCSPTQPRNDGGSPFTTGSGGCYYWNSAQPAGNVDCDSVLNAGRIPLCYCVPGPPAPIPDPNGPWLSGAASQPCSHTCQKEGFANCGKEEMAAINSSAALFTLTSHLNLTCDPPTGTPYRDGGGSPFTTTGGSCYYWDPSKPADEVNCDTVLNSGRQPLCYCVPGPPAPIPGPPENWISAAANQPCDTACSNAGFDECGQEEMAAINSTATLNTLLSLLNLTCTPPATGSPFRDGGGSPFTTASGSCYYWDPSEPASSVSCSTVDFTSRQPLCYCKMT